MQKSDRNAKCILSGWEIMPPAGGVDPAAFLRELEEVIPDGAILHLVHWGDHSEVRRLVGSFAVPDAPQVDASGCAFTVFPIPRPLKRNVMALRAEPESLEALAGFADSHSSLEMCSHLHVTSGDEMVLEFHDFPRNSCYVWDRIDADAVIAFAATLGCQCRRYEPDVDGDA